MGEAGLVAPMTKLVSKPGIGKGPTKVVYKKRKVTAWGSMARNPTDCRRIEKFRIMLAKSGMLKESVRYIERVPECHMMMLERRYSDPASLDFAYFRGLNENTLGYQYARFIEQNELDPQFFGEFETQSQEGYFHRRILETHDLMHVLLGQGTDAPGELHVQGFLLAQVLWPPAPFYIGGYLVREMLRDLNQVPSVMNAATAGWRRGKIAKPVFAVAWETQWERPLEEVRTSLRLEAPAALEASHTAFFEVSRSPRTPHQDSS